jgi:cell fate regulator YaaT (PSP1 superfamily)
MVESSIQLDQLLEDVPATKHRGCGSCGSGKAADGVASSCGNGLEKIYPTTAVRFGYMRYIGEFSHAADMKFSCGAKVIIQTKRGIELGEQVSQTCHGCDKSVTRDQMREWVEACGQDSFIFDAGRILREATAADLAESARIQAGNRAKKVFCQQLANKHKLPMKVVESETLFGGERIILFFMSEERIDFRELVKELAHEYRTRIEMRQVGARDEARLLADLETCGREVCCKVFLKTLRPISMRMAKVQKATLDPTQVSGRCGRLKCCLRYEHTSYEELDRQLPRTGLRIRTNHGEGVIINRQILTQLVQIRKDDGTLLTVVAEDITEVGVPPPAPGSEQEQLSRDQNRDARSQRQRSQGRDRGRPRPASERPDQSSDKRDVGDQADVDTGTDEAIPAAEKPEEGRPTRESGGPDRQRSKGRRGRGRGRRRRPRGGPDSGPKPGGNQPP